MKMLRERVNHKNNTKKESIDKNFWKEFNTRGFKVDPRNAGSYRPEVKHAKFSKKADNSYELRYNDKNKFSVVPAKTFMKTVAQIEGLVKYKLFK